LRDPNSNIKPENREDLILNKALALFGGKA